MTDYFALLQTPRRPWVDVEKLKENFQLLSGRVHPDRLHGADEAARQNATRHYAELNEAYQCLREAKPRLYHLLWLERGKKPGDTNLLPESLMRLFSQVVPLLREADLLMKEKSLSTSAVQRVLVTSKALPCIKRLAAMQDELNGQKEHLDVELRSIDATWSALGPNRPSHETLLGCEKLYHHLGFLDRWIVQLRERSLELTL
jgi:curved DNA-binding protein CbpA